ncbi:MAG: M23 family metallopeptidase [Ruminococcus sp.]|nr:M23 family metallopeptidase [Candidatus Copronaster equi]
MESENVIRKQEVVENKSAKSPVNVTLIQLAVCAFVILIVVAVGKFSPDTYTAIKEEYSKVMSVDMDSADVLESVKGAVNVVNASAHESVEKTDAQNKETTTQKAVAAMAKAFSLDDVAVPVHGTITSRFGNRTNPISGVYTQHTGVDIAASSGTEIHAAYDGVVKSTGEDGRAGKYVKLTHIDSSETLYCHCSKILVSEGETVRAGDTIALVGSTGWSTGPHLHFEIHVDGERINPLEYLEEKDGGV